MRGGRMRPFTHRAWLSVFLTMLPPRAIVGADKQLLDSGHWELHALGITDEAARGRLVAMAARRSVTIAVVGIGGVSRSALANYLDAPPPPGMPWFNQVEYREGATDLKTGTHDTGQVQVILDLTKLLGVRVRLLIYQPPDDYGVIGDMFANAGQEADIVVCFHSFWGPNVRLIAEKTRQTANVLFIAPYGEHGGFPTAGSWQAHALKPDGSGLPNFVTAIPLARKSPGELLRPSARDEQDTETVNFVAPSYHASGSGGTCPAAATTAAVAAFVYAASKRKPKPAAVVRLLADTATRDLHHLTSLPECSDETNARILDDLKRLRAEKKLGTEGLLSLHNLARRLDRKAWPH